MGKRSRHLDIAKGLGILFVVLGHNKMINEEWGRIIFSFHMPLFFFLSGLFFAPERPLRSIFLARLDSLVKPYLVTLVGLGVLLFAYKGINLAEYLLGVLYCTGSTLYWEQLWFIPHLFVVTIFSWVVVYIFNTLGISEKLRYLAVLAVLGVGVAAIDIFWQKEIPLFGRNYILPGLPLSADITFATSFYFLLGWLCASLKEKYVPSPPAVLGCLMLFAACHVFYDSTIDFNMRRYDGILLPTLEAVTGIYIVLAAAYYLQTLGFLARVLATIGSASLFILLFNGLLQGHVYSITAKFLGERYLLAEIIAFVAASLIPVCMWLVVRETPFLRVLFLPVKTRRPADSR